MADLYNLKKVGRVYHCDFVVKGIRVHRSTRKSVKADAETEAKRWYDEALDRANGVVQPETLPEAPTLLDVYEDWVRLKKPQGISKSHLKDMRMAVTVHAGEWASLPILELDNSAIEEIRAFYLDNPGEGIAVNGKKIVRAHSSGGANDVVRSLSTLCNWAVEVKKIPAHPFKIKKLKVQEKARSVLWPEDVKPFFAEADKGGVKWATKKPRDPEHSATAIRMMVGLGLREGEALNADWGWVDWRRKVFVVGGIAIGRRVDIKDRSIREVPLPPWLLQHLEELWTRVKKPTSGVILPRNNNQPHLTGFTKKPVERCGKVLNIPGLTPHRLRATFATGHWEAGTPLTQIQQMMGHESPETTLKHYIVQRPKDQAEAQANLARIMGLEAVIPPKKLGEILVTPSRTLPKTLDLQPTIHDGQS